MRLTWRRDYTPDDLGFVSKVARGLCSASGCPEEALFVLWIGRWWGLCVEHAVDRTRPSVSRL